MNKSKNRYGLVYPCKIIEINKFISIWYFNLDDEDFCRVCLKKETNDQSDYINASIIRSIPPVWN